MKKFAKMQKIDDKSFEKWTVPGAYVNSKGPLDPKDAELIQKCIRDCQKEWKKEKEPPQK